MFSNKAFGKFCVNKVCEVATERRSAEQLFYIFVRDPEFIVSEVGGWRLVVLLRMNLIFGNYDQVAAELRCVTALCGLPGFAEYRLIIVSPESIFVSSVIKTVQYNFNYKEEDLSGFKRLI